MFQLIFFFAFWGAEKHVFHIAPVRPTRYVLQSFRYLEVINRVKKWNNVKNFILVGSKFQLCHLEIPIFIHKIEREYINNQNFIYVLRIYSCNELKWWQNYYFSTIIISNSQIEILVSYSRSTNVNVNMSSLNSKFEGTFSIYAFGKSFWHYRELKNEYWTSRHLY